MTELRDVTPAEAAEITPEDARNYLRRMCEIRYFEESVPAPMDWSKLDIFQAADEPSYRAITESFAYWDDIHILYRGERVVSTGHGFCGLSRRALLNILQDRCRALGVRLHFQHEVAGPGDFPLSQIDTS